ncbi:MAG TPA: hypothetical protein VLC95_11030, partial [Anaerolineae bacterium]|nr:hypothetical protein [Anaerolineae bacterium]
PAAIATRAAAIFVSRFSISAASCNVPTGWATAVAGSETNRVFPSQCSSVLPEGDVGNASNRLWQAKTRFVASVTSDNATTVQVGRKGVDGAWWVWYDTPVGCEGRGKVIKLVLQVVGALI